MDRELDKRRTPRQWAYLYQLMSPLDEPILATIGDLLVEQNAVARERHSSWNARLVVEEGQARILVVCESPSRNRKANRTLEALLRRQGTGFSVTVPMAIGNDITDITGITDITRARRDPD